jgi:putative transcriptional regulator
MTKFFSLKNQFLIAMPALQDVDFNQSVTLICEHNKDGAMGITINNPIELSTVELLKHMNIPCENSGNYNPVLAGGPVQSDRGFVIHRKGKDWKSSLHLNNELSITTSSDILHAIGHDKLPNDTFIALGYAGWGAGQLEQEVLDNSWLSIPFTSELLFETKLEKRWKTATQSLGFNIDQLSYFSGNA